MRLGEEASTFPGFEIGSHGRICTRNLLFLRQASLLVGLHGHMEPDGDCPVAFATKQNDEGNEQVWQRQTICTPWLCPSVFCLWLRTPLRDHRALKVAELRGLAPHPASAEPVV